MHTLRSNPFFAKSFATIVALLCMASSASADAYCTSTIDIVQTENDGKILVQFDNGSWHVIAGSNHPVRADRLSVALSAHLSGKSLRLRYPNGTSCSGNEYSAEPTYIRLLK